MEDFSRYIEATGTQAAYHKKTRDKNKSSLSLKMWMTGGW